MGDAKDLEPTPAQMVAEMRKAKWVPPQEPQSAADKTPAQMVAEMQSAKWTPPPEESTLHKGLDYAARGLDYAGGAVRGIGAEVAGLATGHGSIVTGEDVKNIAVGKGPRSSEYLDRLGVPEGPSAKIPLTDIKVSSRDVSGFALDVLADPLTHLGTMIKAIPAAGKILSEVTGLGANATAEAVGKALYKSGFSKIDAEMVKQGSEPLSELLLASGAPSGTTAQIANKVQKMTAGMNDSRQALYDAATAKGAAVDLSQQPLEKAEAYIAKLAADKRPAMQKAAAALSEHLNTEYKAVGSVDLATLSQYKTDITMGRMQLPGEVPQAIGNKFNELLSSDFRQSVVDAGNEAGKGLGTKISDINEKWGTLIESAKPVAQQVKQAASKSVISPLKVAVTAHNPLVGAAWEAADAANTTVVKTTAGKALMSGAAGTPYTAGATFGDAARQGLAASQAGPPATLGQSVMHGSGAVNSLRKPGQ